ncbi:glutamate ligase domain-containing protein [Propionivibrio sp.]|uniref:glutamate ligase domain-containing protein n=1 Tax=Propionivibrio sp. TaxID=2212460 RepID=UPI0039E31F23
MRTRLCGAHFVPSVLGAIGGGLASGLSLTECAEAIEHIAPFTGRMQPVTTDDGVTFIRDDFKAPLWTLDASLEFMRAAHAARKIVVIGELSDTGPGKGEKYAKAANKVLDVADIAVFAGPWASSAHKGRCGEPPGDHPRAQRQHCLLERRLQAGDVLRCLPRQASSLGSAYSGIP